MSAKRGFTLIEVLIGFFIAVLAATYAARSITSTNKVVGIGRNTFIATNLAHEGIDLTRAMRDTTWFSDATPSDRSEWMSKSGICESDNDTFYTIDADRVRGFVQNPDDTSHKVTHARNPLLYNQGEGRVWTHNVTSTKTPFKRILTAKCADAVSGKNPMFVEIHSTVLWKQGADEKSVTIKERLYNWML